MNLSRRTLSNLLFIKFLGVTLLFTSCSEEAHEQDITSISDYGTSSDSSVVQPIFKDSAAYHFLTEVGLVITPDVLKRNLSTQSSSGVNFGQADSISENFSFYIDPNFFELTEGDSSYIQKQIDFANEKIWDLKELGQDSIWNAHNDWRLENPKFDWDKFKDSGFGCFVDLGVPLFNKAHDIAIIYVGYQCHYLMGAGSIHKYEKIDGKWIFKEKANLWIS